MLNDFDLALQGFHLTTAEILYHMPDHPLILQTYIWQEFDVPPEFPKLMNFIHFWNMNIEGRIKRVQVAYAGHLAAPRIQALPISFELH